MSRQQTFEQKKLLEAYSLLTKFSPLYEEQLLILEATASLFSGFDVAEYWHAFKTPVDSPEAVVAAARHIREAIKLSGVPAPLALAALSREPIPIADQKKNGAFYTDFRLAQFMASDCESHLTNHCKIADLACGSGILLAAVSIKFKELFPDCFNEWLSTSVFAFDLSANALRGTRIALASLSDNINSLQGLNRNSNCGDSLAEDKLNGMPYDIVIGNPPWGKVKLSLHSFVSQSGEQHIYGTEYSDCNYKDFSHEREKAISYSRFLKEKFSLMEDAEPDLYMAFLQKALYSLNEGGHLSYLIPAGIIRSKGTEALRRYLLKNGNDVQYTLFDNKEGYFSIDTRFKFVFLSCNNNTADTPTNFYLAINGNGKSKRKTGEAVKYDIQSLEKIRPDLTVPECNNNDEKRIFFKIYESGKEWGENWHVDITREVDMTNDKPLFSSTVFCDSVPVIEGRMVQQHRFGAKTYISGSGRSATWRPCTERATSQFYIRKSSLSNTLSQRISSKRAGYCDIAGQTNERAMMSALIPENVVCGNKVPTIVFQEEAQLLFWIGVTNSFVFDWVIRRIISTTVNYFLLLSVPLPNISLNSSLAKKIIDNTKRLAKLGKDFYCGNEMQQLRADIDAAVAMAYGLNLEELEIILEDFPLLDRKQPPIFGEKRSTVTKDLVLSKIEAESESDHGYIKRVEEETKCGAVAYIPSEMVELCERGEQECRNKKTT